MSERKLFHFGVVVDDLDKGMTVWGGMLGTTWAAPLVAETPFLGPDGVEGRKVNYTYSLLGPPYIELLELVEPGPYLKLTGGRYIHHLGLWSDDLTADSAELVSDGFVRELSGEIVEGRITRSAYHRHPVSPGLWVELVDSAMRVDIEAWLRAGAGT